MLRLVSSDAATTRHPVMTPPDLLRRVPDTRLVEQMQAGSERAFEIAFERHHRCLLTFCRRMLGSEQDAEDAVQQTFMAAYRDVARTSRPIALRPWLYGIARHRCLATLRARREQPVAEVPAPATDQLTAEVIAREDVRTLLRDLVRLPEHQRAALVLAELGDLSHAEIAGIVGCRPDKVKALVFQARASLAASRSAHDLACDEIREQLVTLRGGALRRADLRRHVRDCRGCRAYRDDLRRRRPGLGLLLPTPLGLKRWVLGALFGSGGGGAGTATITAGVLSGGLLAATLAVVAIPAGGATAPADVAHDRRPAASVTTAAAAVMRDPAAAVRASALGRRRGEQRVRDRGAVVPGEVHAEHVSPAASHAGGSGAGAWDVPQHHAAPAVAEPARVAPSGDRPVHATDAPSTRPAPAPSPSAAAAEPPKAAGPKPPKAEHKPGRGDPGAARTVPVRPPQAQAPDEPPGAERRDEAAARAQQASPVAESPSGLPSVADDAAAGHRAGGRAAQDLEAGAAPVDAGSAAGGGRPEGPGR
jgi:RNA polymerase sigma factor (sigma-70 family)